MPGIGSVSVDLSLFLRGVVDGLFSSDDDVQEALADLGVRSVRSAVEAGFLGVDSAAFVVRFDDGRSVLVSFQDCRS